MKLDYKVIRLILFHFSGWQFELKADVPTKKSANNLKLLNCVKDDCLIVFTADQLSLDYFIPDRLFSNS